MRSRMRLTPGTNLQAVLLSSAVMSDTTLGNRKRQKNDDDYPWLSDRKKTMWRSLRYVGLYAYPRSSTDYSILF